MTMFRQYVEEHCGKKGEPKTNLTGGQEKGTKIFEEEGEGG